MESAGICGTFNGGFYGFIDKDHHRCLAAEFVCDFDGRRL